MREEFIKFGTAILAKDRGFNIKTKKSFIETLEHSVYDYRGGEDILYKYESPRVLGTEFWLGRDNSSMHDKLVAYCPTQSLLQRWLREKHNCFVEVCMHGEEGNNWTFNPKNIQFGVEVDFYGADFQVEMTEGADFNEYNFKSYEEALERGLYQALKLIPDDQV